MRRLIVAFSVAAVLLGAAFAGPVSAKSFTGAIVLPGATSAEGIASGAGSTFYAGDLNNGNIYRGDLRSGSASLFITAPAGRMAFGMKVDVKHHLLVVAGGFTGQGYVYDTRTGATVAVRQLANPADGSTIINDVIVAGGNAWFTDSARANLYRVPIGHNGTVGAASTLALNGPAADLTGMFNLNGIAATPNGKTLIVAHTANRTLYTVNPKTGASAPIAGADVPNVDGILLQGDRLWAVQNFSNQITELRLSHHFSRARVKRVITNGLFGVPTTVARHGKQLLAVNSHFDVGHGPYQVVVLNGH